VLILVSKKIAVSFQSCSFVPLFLVCVCSPLFPCLLVTLFQNIDKPHKRRREKVKVKAYESRLFGETYPLWSSGQSSWLHIQRSGFDSRRYQNFWEVVGLERGTLSLVSTFEELLERKSSGSYLEIREYGRRNPSRWPRGTLYPKKVGTNFADMQRSLGRYRV
jgi:hypothetical protein